MFIFTSQAIFLFETILTNEKFQSRNQNSNFDDLPLGVGYR